jgi:hypothetical protein
VSTTPAEFLLFNLDDGAEKSDEDKAQLFHHLVAKLLYLSQRSRQDIQTAVAFLCTRVQSPEAEAGTRNEEPTWYKRHNTDHKGKRRSQMVGRQFIGYKP